MKAYSRSFQFDIAEHQRLSDRLKAVSAREGQLTTYWILEGMQDPVRNCTEVGVFHIVSYIHTCIVYSL